MTIIISINQLFSGQLSIEFVSAVVVAAINE